MPTCMLQILVNYFQTPKISPWAAETRPKKATSTKTIPRPIFIFPGSRTTGFKRTIQRYLMKIVFPVVNNKKSDGPNFPSLNHLRVIHRYRFHIRTNKFTHKFAKFNQSTTIFTASVRHALNI